MKLLLFILLKLLVKLFRVLLDLLELFSFNILLWNSFLLFNTLDSYPLNILLFWFDSESLSLGIGIKFFWLHFFSLVPSEKFFSGFNNSFELFNWIK